MSGHYFKSPYLVKSTRLARQSVTCPVGTADGPLLGPNPRRRGLIFSAPPAGRDPYTRKTLVAQTVDTNTLGTKLSYTVPAGLQAVVTGHMIRVGAGTPNVVWTFTTGGVGIVVSGHTASAVVQEQVQLGAGDIAAWVMSVVGGVGSICDFYISVQEERQQNRYTLGFAGPAVLDAGPTVYPGADPLCILQGEVAHSLTEEVRAISAGAPQAVTVIELFDFLEELPRGRHA